MTSRILQTTVTVGFSPIATTSLSKAFLEAVQRKQQHTFKLVEALRDKTFLKGFIQEGTELFRKEKNDQNLRVIILGIVLIQEKLPRYNESYELAALHIGCWMELFQEDRAFQMIRELSGVDKENLKCVISQTVQDGTDPLHATYQRIHDTLELSS